LDKVSHIILKGEAAKTILNIGTYPALVLIDSADSYLKLSSPCDDSMAEPSKDYKYIEVNFNDLAIVPNGAWQEINVKKGKPVTVIIHLDRRWRGLAIRRSRRSMLPTNSDIMGRNCRIRSSRTAAGWRSMIMGRVCKIRSWVGGGRQIH
jgi:hypothetical protein